MSSFNNVKSNFEEPSVSLPESVSSQTSGTSTTKESGVEFTMILNVSVEL